jgi:hypothetical protein
VDPVVAGADASSKGNTPTPPGSPSPSPSPPPSFGFIPKAYAPIATTTEEEKPKPALPSSSPGNPYKSMFVKGASEFVDKSKDVERKEADKKIEEEDEEELPEGMFCLLMLKPCFL